MYELRADILNHLNKVKMHEGQANCKVDILDICQIIFNNVEMKTQSAYSLIVV